MSFVIIGKRLAPASIDSQNIAGAVRLYERAGMSAAWKYNLFEKVLQE